MEQYTLANGVQIPVIGLGTWQTPDDETGYQAVLSALQLGYRHIDTAQGYRNEDIVGRAVKDSGIARLIPKVNATESSNPRRSTWNNDDFQR